MKKLVNRISQKGFLLAIMLMTILPVGAADDNLVDSDVVEGMTDLISDASTVLLVLCPSVAAVAITYFLIRRSMADEQDGKRWQDRAVTAAVCGVAGLLASAFISILSSYFV